MRKKKILKKRKVEKQASKVKMKFDRSFCFKGEKQPGIQIDTDTNPKTKLIFLTTFPSPVFPVKSRI
uniref:Uncharacterized protein n=1 Tax=Rhizophora mucronata TaxID=61149 RepID=A0A2P2JVU5_RHIMU